MTVVISTKPAESPEGDGAKSAKAKPLKALPTARLTFDKQLSIIRAYAAASGNERKLVSNADVGKIVEVDQNSVSLCNTFLREIQLIAREGHNHRPSDAAFDYFQAWQWNQETAALKLRPAIEASWFAIALMPRLNFRSMTKTEAMQVLAEEIKAPKEYEGNLALLIEYLKIVGIITVENGTVSIGPKIAAAAQEKPPVEKPEVPREKPLHQPQHTQQFSIPIPGKAAATITVPDNLDADDWGMLGEMISTYIKRWKNFSPAQNDSKKGEGQ